MTTNDLTGLRQNRKPLVKKRRDVETLPTISVKSEKQILLDKRRVLLNQVKQVEKEIAAIG